MSTNNFLPFCPTDTGTNLLSQSDYAAATDRTSGNKAGVASSKLNNKAIRQSAFIVSQIAQFVADRSTDNVLDDADTATLLASIKKAFGAPVLNVASKTTGYTVLISDGIVLGDASGGAFALTLPAASAVAGKVFYFKKTDSSTNAVTITRAGSDTIDGDTTYLVSSQYESVVLVSNGSNWFVF